MDSPVHKDQQDKQDSRGRTGPRDKQGTPGFRDLQGT